MACLCVIFTGCGTALTGDTNPASSQPAKSKALAKSPLERARRNKPAKTPPWVNAIPDRLADILIHKHLYAESEVWGLARTTPGKGMPYDAVGSQTFLRLVRQYDLFDEVSEKIGPLDEKARKKAAAFWQSWQDLPRAHDIEKLRARYDHDFGGAIIAPRLTDRSNTDKKG